jgi:hypothetical protein
MEIRSTLFSQESEAVDALRRCDEMKEIVHVTKEKTAYTCIITVSLKYFLKLTLPIL